MLNIDLHQPGTIYQQIISYKLEDILKHHHYFVMMIYITINLSKTTMLVTPKYRESWPKQNFYFDDYIGTGLRKITRSSTKSIHLAYKSGTLLMFRSSRRDDFPILSSISSIIPDINLK